MKIFSKKNLIRIIFLTNALLISAIFLEISLSRFLPQKTYNWLYRGTKGCYRKSDFTVFTLMPDCKIPMQNYDTHENFTMDINSLGLRGENITQEKTKGVPRILFEGDSFTLGFGVKNDEVVTSKLAYLFKSSSETGAFAGSEVVNAGYAGGFGPDGYFLHLKNNGMKFQPDLVIFGLFLFNDFSDMEDNEWIGTGKWGEPEKIVSRSTAVDDSGYLIPKILPLVYRLPILKNSHLAVLSASAFARMGALMKHYTDRIYFKLYPPTFPGGDATDDNLIGAYRSACIFADKCHRKTMHLYSDLLSLFKASEELAGKKFLVLLVPAEFQIYPEKLAKYHDEGLPFDSATQPDPNPQRRLKKMLDNEKIKYLDLLPVFRKETQRTYFENDGHWNAYGHEVAAREIYKWIEENY